MIDENVAWIQTSLGYRFYILHPEWSVIDIRDIAAALSKLCRYGGHCKRFLSIAEHSVHAASVAPPEFKLTALMHDASEAYVVDIPRPIKPLLKNYYEIEEKIMATIASRFGFLHPLPPEVKKIDTALLADEYRQNMIHSNECDEAWKRDCLHYPSLGIKLQYWSPEEAEEKFLEAYHETASAAVRMQI